jgi:hypothetical protein
LVDGEVVVICHLAVFIMIVAAAVAEWRRSQVIDTILAGLNVASAAFLLRFLVELQV